MSVIHIALKYMYVYVYIVLWDTRLCTSTLTFNIAFAQQQPNLDGHTFGKVFTTIMSAFFWVNKGTKPENLINNIIATIMADA